MDITMLVELLGTIVELFIEAVKAVIDIAAML